MVYQTAQNPSIFWCQTDNISAYFSLLPHKLDGLSLVGEGTGRRGPGDHQQQQHSEETPLGSGRDGDVSMGINGNLTIKHANMMGYMPLNTCI